MTNGPTDRPTTGLLELLWAAKNNPVYMSSKLHLPARKMEGHTTVMLDKS